MPIICLMVRENHKMVREMSGKSQGILWGLMAGHPAQFWSKSTTFFSRMTLKFNGWPSKTIGHLFYETSSFVHHFVAIARVVFILPNPGCKQCISSRDPHRKMPNCVVSIAFFASWHKEESNVGVRQLYVSKWLFEMPPKVNKCHV